MNLMKGPRGEPLILEADAAAAIAAEPAGALAIAQADNGKFLVRILSVTAEAAEFHIIAQLVEPWQTTPVSRKRDHAEN